MKRWRTPIFLACLLPIAMVNALRGDALSGALLYAHCVTLAVMVALRLRE